MFRTSFWALSPAWTEMLTRKRRLANFKIDVFPLHFFYMLSPADSPLGWLPGLSHIGVPNSPYAHGKWWFLWHCHTATLPRCHAKIRLHDLTFPF